MGEYYHLRAEVPIRIEESLRNRLAELKARQLKEPVPYLIKTYDISDESSFPQKVVRAYSSAIHRAEGERRARLQTFFSRRLELNPPATVGLTVELFATPDGALQFLDDLSQLYLTELSKKKPLSFHDRVKGRTIYTLEGVLLGTFELFSSTDLKTSHRSSII